MLRHMLVTCVRDRSARLNIAGGGRSAGRGIWSILVLWSRYVSRMLRGCRSIGTAFSNNCSSTLENITHKIWMDPPLVQTAYERENRAAVLYPNLYLKRWSKLTTYKGNSYQCQATRHAREVRSPPVTSKSYKFTL